jgi:hypothetical protein
MSIVVATGAAATAPNVFDTLLAGINNSPYMSAAMMLMLNLGGRFLGMELTKGQEKFFSHPIFRRFLIFCIMFVATRNILIAIWLAALIILIIGYVANENSAMCLFGRGAVEGTTCAKAEGFAGGAGLTQEEENILKMLQEKKARSGSTGAVAADAKGKQAKKDIVETYKANIAKLH